MPFGTYETDYSFDLTQILREAREQDSRLLGLQALSEQRQGEREVGGTFGGDSEAPGGAQDSKGGPGKPGEGAQQGQPGQGQPAQAQQPPLATRAMRHLGTAATKTRERFDSGTRQMAGATNPLQYGLGLLDAVFPFSAGAGYLAGQASSAVADWTGQLTDEALDAQMKGKQAQIDPRERRALEALRAMPYEQRVKQIEEGSEQIGELASGVVPGYTGAFKLMQGAGLRKGLQGFLSNDTMQAKDLVGGLKQQGLPGKDAAQGARLADAVREQVQAVAPGPRQVKVDPSGIQVMSPEIAANLPPRVSSPDVRRIASEYARGAGLPDVTPAELRRVDPVLAKTIADTYEAMKHSPSDPQVRAAYDAFVDETWQQFVKLQDEGYIFEPWTKPGQPYASSAEMATDVLENKHLYFFTGGELAPDHPMLRLMPNGWTANEVFRVVHDIFGHSGQGHQFGPTGETNAWIAHGSLYSKEAVPAMSTETIGQNSWVNFGAHLRDEAGNVPGKGQEGFTPPGERPYAEQKAGVMDPAVMKQAETETRASGFASEVRGPLSQGGFTYHPERRVVQPTEGYAVSVEPGRSRSFAGQPTDEDLSSFYRSNTDLMEQNPDLHLGAEVVEGKTNLDLSRVVPDLEQAHELGRQNKQERIWGFREGKAIDVDYTPAWARPLIKAGEAARIRALETWKAVGDPARAHELTDVFAQGGDLAKNLSIYGAALLVRGGLKAWDSQMLKEFGEAIKPHLETIRHKAEVILSRMIRSSFDQAQASKAALKFFSEGKEGFGWYGKTLPELSQIYGPEDAKMLIGFLAATSPNTSVQGNATFALKAFEQWKLTGGIDAGKMREIGSTIDFERGMSDEGFKGFMGSTIKNLERAAKGEELHGMKVKNFHAALLGDENAVVIDRWILRALWPEKAEAMDTKGTKITEDQYNFLATWIRNEATKRGVTPVDLQAAIWVGVKKLQGTRNDYMGPFEGVIKEKIATRKASVEKPIQRELGFEDFSQMIDEEVAR